MSSVKVRSKRKMKRKVAAVAAGLMSIAGVAGASVIVQNFMSAEFTATAAPCLIKTAGTDVAFDGFEFATGPAATPIDNVNLTEEHITINGVTGDRVTANDVYVITNNCDVDLEVKLTAGAQTGDWTQKHLEVWLGNTAAPGNYPNITTGWDDDPLLFEDTTVVPALTTNYETGTVTLAANGGSVPVGMVVSTGDGAVVTGTGDAIWTVQAEWP